MDKKLKDLIRRILLAEEALAEQLSHRTSRRPKASAAGRIKRQKRRKKCRSRPHEWRATDGAHKRQIKETSLGDSVGCSFLGGNIEHHTLSRGLARVRRPRQSFHMQVQKTVSDMSPGKKR
jgi:hypothetical protein